MTPEEFWESSALEIADRMESYRRQKQQEIKEKIRLDFSLAKLIATHVWADKETKLPLPWDVYPELFKKEQAAYEKEKAEEEWEAFKERRRQYVAEFNRRRHQGGGEGT